jgi:hypothetical protein
VHFSCSLNGYHYRSLWITKGLLKLYLRLRHYATSWKVAGWIPDDVNRIFYWLNGPGVESSSNRNKYQRHFLKKEVARCVRLKTLAPSCAEYLLIWEPPYPVTLKTRNRPEQGLLYILPVSWLAVFVCYNYCSTRKKLILHPDWRKEIILIHMFQVTKIFVSLPDFQTLDPGTVKMIIVLLQSCLVNLNTTSLFS